MTRADEIATRLLGDADASLECFTRICLFGSVLSSEVPQDLDILLVYRDDDIRRAALHKARLYRYWSSVVALPLHIMMLSERELRETRFLKEVSHLPIWNALYTEAN